MSGKEESWTPADIDEIRMEGIDTINSMDVSEEEKQVCHGLVESMITLVEQYTGNTGDGLKMLIESFQQAEKRRDEGIVDDTPKHKQLADVLNVSIRRIDMFQYDPDKYNHIMKSTAVPLNIMIIENFKDDDLAKKEHGEIISDFLEKIFVEHYTVLSDDEDKGHVTRGPTLDIFDQTYGNRIRSVLPQKECYDLISILYETYQVIGKNDLTETVTETIEEWLTHNQACVKSANTVKSEKNEK